MKKYFAMLLPVILLLTVSCVFQYNTQYAVRRTHNPATNDSNIETKQHHTDFSTTSQTQEDNTMIDLYDNFSNTHTIIRETDIRRITVVVNGVDSFLDIINSVNIQTADGTPVVRHNNCLYILESETVAREVGTIWEQGSDSVEFCMYDGSYLFNIDTELVHIIVTYHLAYSKRISRLMYYDLENASSVRLELSNYDSSKIGCYFIDAEGEQKVSAQKLPDELEQIVFGYLGWDGN